MTDPREAKLPVWAQESLQALRIQVSRLERDLEQTRNELGNGPEDSRISFETEQGIRRLRQDGIISFQVDSGEIDCELDKGRLRISTVGAPLTITTNESWAVTVEVCK